MNHPAKTCPTPTDTETRTFLPKVGWNSTLARASCTILLFLTITGLAVPLTPFSAWVQWGILAHTLIGVVTLLPLAIYLLWHTQDYRNHAASHITLLGWVASVGLLLVSVSGLIITFEALLGNLTSPFWRRIHLLSTVTLLAGTIPHIIAVILKQWRTRFSPGITGFSASVITSTITALVLSATPAWLYHNSEYVNQFPADYSYLYGTNRPFAPSLATTDTGGALDARSLAGSHSCGTIGCHDQILEEWLPSAHRYAAMDPVFQGIQQVMAQQNGPESTRYCGGCHDPISLFSGTKNLFVEDLTGLHGYQEGISCLACHAIRETDIQGNANYTVTQPHQYLWQWQTNGITRTARDFLIRSYPAEHNKLSKRAYKKPEYCAACHKQFIDAEVNRVGWVQLQNQYDNWAASHWNQKGDAARTVECRECHMPLVDSHDPAAGDPLDYNRTTRDGKHRSHRFIAANTLIPTALQTQLQGADTHLKLTEQWLRGELPIPEIADKWANGPIVTLQASAPNHVAPGEPIPLRVVMSSNKVGHDFPTGPLDLIQSWLDITATDNQGHVIWTSGKRDTNHFLQPGTFLFKAEPVDQHGNLIDRHNLWEMVGVRFRRALFPGYSDTVQFSIPCAGNLTDTNSTPNQYVTPNQDHLEIPTPTIPAPQTPGAYLIHVALQYRKVDQFLLNYLFGETNRLTSPVTTIAQTSLKVNVSPQPTASTPKPQLTTASAR